MRLKLNRLNKSSDAQGVESNLLSAGFKPFESENFNGLSEMTIYKGRERHSKRHKKRDGTFTLLQSYESVEGAEKYIFVALSAERRLLRRGEDGKKREYLYCKLFYRLLLK